MPDTDQQANNAQRKTILAGVLGVVFVGVVLWRVLEPSGDQTSAPEPPPQAGYGAAGASLSDAAACASSTPEPVCQPLPAVDMSVVLAKNPFSKRSAVLDSGASKTDSPNRPAPLDNDPSGAVAGKPPGDGPREEPAEVRGIVHGPRPAILVDGELVEENGVLAGRWRVVGIERDAVIVEPLD